MDAVQEPAEQSSAEMREGIHNTRADMADKLEALENRMIGTVQSAQETVQDSIQSAKDAVASVKRTFDIKHQVEEHPWAMVGGCVLAGLAVGYYIPSRSPRVSSIPEIVPESDNADPPPTPPAPAAPPPSLLEPFQDEIDKVKGMAIGFVMGLVRDSLKVSAPQLAPNIDQLMNGLTTKLGGTTVDPLTP
jgi:ElaB/YqjD/DUF883 family membrane-anchored ribosome-binding protein